MREELELLPECPFFMEFKGKNVYCEGTVPGSTLGLHFNRPKDFKKFKTAYCCSMNYENCPMARMLYSKYGE